LKVENSTDFGGAKRDAFAAKYVESRKYR